MPFQGRLFWADNRGYVLGQNLKAPPWGQALFQSTRE